LFQNMPGPTKPPPAGWRLFNAQLVPDPTIGGFLARGQVVRGTCQRRDCNRRYWIDFEGLIRHGYSGFPMKELESLLVCRMPGGCSLVFHEDREGSGLPLSLLATYPGVQVRVRCGACRWEKEVSPSRMAASLKAAGGGGGETLHTEIADKLQRPCKCGKTQWFCEVTWPALEAGWNSRSQDAGFKAARRRG